MFRTMCTSKSGMIAQQARLDAISNNLANSSTTGYKSVDVGFADLLQYSLDRKSIPINDRNSSIGTGVRATDYFRNNDQGPLISTGLSTDLALDKEGYFKVILADGTEAYTRDGAFKIDANGDLVNSYGDRLELNFEPGYSRANCNFKTDNFTVGTDGSVYIKNGNGTMNKVAEIPIYTAIGDNAFTAVGENLFVPSVGTNVQRTRNTDVYQGHLEGSNVDLTLEMTNMITTQRALQLSSKGVTTADEMWQMINNMRR